MPNTWANGVNGMLEESEWLDFPFDPSVSTTDPIDKLFLDEQSSNIKAKWASVSSEYLIPKMAKYHAFDTEANKTVRPVLENHEIEKGLIKVKLNQSEELRKHLNNGVRENELYKYVFNDAMNLAIQIKTRTLVAKYEVMATGKVTIGENNLKLSIDFGLGSDQKGYTLNLTNSFNPLDAIEDIVNAAKRKGIKINGMMTASANITSMRRNTNVQTVINGTLSSGATVKRSTFDDFLATEYGITNIIEADGLYDPDNESFNGSSSIMTHQTLRYFPENKITFFATMPNGKLGGGLWGVPPSVTIPDSNARGSSISQYVYIDQWTEKDPAVLWTRASAVFIPILINPDSLFIADVISNGDGA